MARMAKLSGLLLLLLMVIDLDSRPQVTQTAQPSPAPSPAASAPAAQPAQTPEQKPQTVYESATVLKAITRLVVVDVVATDKQSRAVTDLQRDDFTLMEDGIKQQVRAFSLQQPAPALAANEKPVLPKLPEGVFSNVPRYKSNTSLSVILLDALNTTAPHQAYVREEMIKYLRKMPEGQPVAVYLLSSKLALLQDFTTDPAVLQEVVHKLKGKISPLLDGAAGGSEPDLLPPGQVDSGMIPDQMLQSIMRFEQERVAFQTDLRITYTVSAMKSIAHSLSGYPGRKNLIWISEAFPINIDPNLELTSDPFAGTRNYSHQIGEAADALTDAQIAIYPVDARGLVTSSLFDASNSGNDRFGRSRGRNPTLMTNAISNENANLAAVHGTMQEMAERTGGKAFYNRNDLDGAIRRSIEDGSTYYTLAYYPENKDWNGKFRKIKITTERQGVKLRYRLGYYAVDPKSFSDQNQKQQAQAFGDALSFDSPVSTGLLFEAGVAPPSDKTANKVLVNFALDAHALNFENGADGLHHAVIDCVVQAYSSKGKLIKTEATTVTASLKPQTYAKVMQEGFPCQRTIDLPAGAYFLRLGVRDGHTGLIGTANAHVTVASAAPAGATK